MVTTSVRLDSARPFPIHALPRAMSKPPSPDEQSEKRRPGRPPTYVFSKPDAELSENERRLKGSVIKRRLRQNRSYHRKKRLKELAEQAARSGQPHVHNLGQSSAQSAGQLMEHGLGLALGQPVLPGISDHRAHTASNVDQTIAALSSAQFPTTAASLASTTSHGLGQDQTVPIPSAAGTLYSSQISASCTPADALAFLAMNASRARDAGTSVINPRVVPTSQAFRLTPPGEGNTAIDITVPSVHEKVLGTGFRSPNPRFDGSMIQLPTSNVQVHVQNSGGTPFLSVSCARTPTNAKNTDSSSEDKDEAQLLADILDSSDQRHTDAVSPVARGASTRPFLNQDLGIRMSSLPHVAVEGLKHLVLFPGSFTAESALIVMGLSQKPTGNGSIGALQPLVDVKLLRELPTGRFELNDITKSLIANEAFDDARDARHRFVSCFLAKLRSLDPNSLSSKGETRLEAMKVYDVERSNMDVALQMCRDIGGKRLIMEFLTLAATVMRYSTSAHDRVEIFGRVLSELAASSAGETTDLLAEARIRLGLGEAYFDLLEFDTAEDQLRTAIGVMTGTEGGCLPVASSVLALLLLAELRISDRDFEEAKKLLVQALKSLKDAELQKSTFAVCCLLSLASVYMSVNQSDEALHTVNAALEVLTGLGFSHMPIYADALGTLGSVHVQKGNWQEAQTLFYSGLSLIQSWMSRKDWDRAPFQHCAHLDIFLVESIAQSYTAQERPQEAGQLFARARQQRQERGLGPHAPQNTAESSGEGRRYSRIYTRHLY